MSIRSSTYFSSTASLFQVVDAVRIITDPGPKWRYDLRPVEIEYATGDVKPKATTDDTVYGYNVYELDNTTTTWFGLADSEYAGLEFNAVPTGTVVLAVASPGPMVTSAGAPDITIDEYLLFQYPNQLSGTCA